MASQPHQGIGEVGYAALESKDLILDILHENREFDPIAILQQVIKNAGRNTKNIPVFRYLTNYGITSKEQYEKSGLCLDKWVNRDIQEFRSKNYTAAFFRKYRHLTIEEIIHDCTPENAAAYIPFLSKDKIDLDILKNFLVENIEKIDYQNSSYASSFRKLVVLYDRLKWGWIN